MNNDSRSPKTLVFNMSIDLWNFLFPDAIQNVVAAPKKRTNHKLTKDEAFFDLMNRERLHQCSGDESFSKMSINALAHAWGWQRPTVKNFLENLRSLGVLSFYAENVSILVKLHNIVGLQPLTSVGAPAEESADISQDS